MDKLPSELIDKVFSYLNLEDRYGLRAVCKGWKFLIENSNKKLKSLLISEPENSTSKFIFYHTGVNRLFIDDYEPFKGNHLFLDCNQIHKLLLKSSSIILDNTERLVLNLTYVYNDNQDVKYGAYDDDIECSEILENFFKILPSFKRLHKLHIEKNEGSLRKFEEDNRYFLLELDTVTIFSFIGFRFIQFTLEAPKLIKLKLDLELSYLSIFKNIPCVQLFETNSLDYFHAECLIHLKYFYGESQCSAFSESFFENLQSLEVYCVKHVSSWVEANSDFIENFQRSIFYLESFKVKDLKNYDDDLFLIYKHDPNQFETCDRFPFMADFIYDYLQYDSMKLNRANLMKLVHLKKFFLQEMVENETKLIRFIREYNPHFTHFHFHNCQLSQDFYDQLPSSADFVEHLELFEKFTFHNFSDFNFDFILDLKYLDCFKTDQVLSLEFAAKLFNQLKYLSHLYFVNDKCSCYLGKIYYEIGKRDKNPVKFEFKKYGENDEIKDQFGFFELEDFEDFLKLKAKNLMCLPYEILEIIFYHFSLEERIKYKEVNKKWKFLIEKLDEKDLIISDKESYVNQSIKRWFVDDYKFFDGTQVFLSINELDKIFRKSYYNRLKSVVRLNVCLKSLKTKELATKLFDEVLIKFEDLEQLGIIDYFGNYDQRIEINQKKLKILQLDGLKFSDIYLDTPNLKKVCFDCDLDNVRIIHPETINFIYLKKYHHILEELTSVKKIYCKELSVKFNHEILHRHYTIESIHIFHGIEDFVIDLIKQKTKYCGGSVKIFYSNCLIKSESDYVDFLELKKDNNLADFYKSKRLKFDDEFLFEKTLKFKNLDFDIQILKKFKKLDRIYVNGKTNESLLEKTINDYGCFNYFLFKNTDLSQHFFNNLKTHAVLRLAIISNSIDLKFKFLLKLKFLESFKTDSKLELDLIEKLITQLKYLTILESKDYSLDRK